MYILFSTQDKSFLSLLLRVLTKNKRRRIFRPIHNFLDIISYEDSICFGIQDQSYLLPLVGASTTYKRRKIFRPIRNFLNILSYEDDI